MQHFNICTKRTYTDKKTSEERTQWLNCGSLRVGSDGKQFVELNMFPNETFYVFEKKQMSK